MYSKIFFMYQPKFCYNEVFGHEALLRAVFDNGKILYPDKLIEKHKGDLFFDYFIINKVISELSSLNYNDIRKNSISINVSSLFMSTEIDLNNIDFDKIDKFNLKLELEILESDKIIDFDMCNNNINKLLSNGISVSLDDFGKEFCSIERLSRLSNIKFVKLDKNLIDGIEYSSSKYSVLKSICDLIKEFNFELLAEGVETKGEYELLLKLGICYYQGFYFGKPLLIS